MEVDLEVADDSEKESSEQGNFEEEDISEQLSSEWMTLCLDHTEVSDSLFVGPFAAQIAAPYVHMDGSIEMVSVDTWSGLFVVASYSSGAEESY